MAFVVHETLLARFMLLSSLWPALLEHISRFGPEPIGKVGHPEHAGQGLEHPEIGHPDSLGSFGAQVGEVMKVLFGTSG